MQLNTNNNADMQQMTDEARYASLIITYIKVFWGAVKYCFKKL